MQSKIKISKIKEFKVKDAELEFNCYRIMYENDKFNISFGTFDKENNKVLINTDINFSKEGFKNFFKDMLYCIVDYENKTDNKFLEIEEDE